jgi:transcriptional regulator with XRE-family HTH domain
MDVLDPVFPRQVRAARALLGWTQRDLARRANVSEPFINRLERFERLGQASKLRQLRDALILAGVEFHITENGFAVGLYGEAAHDLRNQLQQLRDC